MHSPDDPPIGDRVVERTADLLDRDALELEPLGAVIDPALLREFAASDAVRPESELVFQYCDCEVRISGAGDVDLERVE